MILRYDVGVKEELYGTCTWIPKNGTLEKGVRYVQS